MKRCQKIVSYSIAIGFVIIIVLSICGIILMGYSTADHRISDIKQNLDSIISRIESYNVSNHTLPEAMSQLNFKQTINGYLYEGNMGIDIRFRYYNLSDGSYLVEVFNEEEDSIINQFYSPAHQWENEPDNMVWFKIETKAYELSQIKKIHDILNPVSSYRFSIPFTLDSVTRNDNILSILSDITIHCDSIGYLTIKSPDKQTRMEGWTAFDRYVYPAEYIIRKSKNPEKPKRKVQNPAKIRRNHNSKRLLKYKSRNIGMIKKSIGSKQIRCSFFAYRSRNIIKHYVRVMGIIVH